MRVWNDSNCAQSSGCELSRHGALSDTQEPKDALTTTTTTLLSFGRSFFLGAKDPATQWRRQERGETVPADWLRKSVSRCELRGFAGAMTAADACSARLCQADQTPCVIRRISLHLFSFWGGEAVRCGAQRGKKGQQLSTNKPSQLVGALTPNKGWRLLSHPFSAFFFPGRAPPFLQPAAARTWEAKSKERRTAKIPFLPRTACARLRK